MVVVAVAAMIIAITLVGALIIREVPDGEGEAVQGIGGGARRDGEVGEEVEREQVSMEEDVVSRRQVNG